MYYPLSRLFMSLKFLINASENHTIIAFYWVFQTNMKFIQMESLYNKFRNKQKRIKWETILILIGI